MNKKNLTVALFVAVAMAAFCSQTVSARSFVAHKSGDVCAQANSPLKLKLKCAASAVTFQSAFNLLTPAEQERAEKNIRNAQNNQDIANAITRAARVRRVSGSNVSDLSNNVYNAVAGRK